MAELETKPCGWKINHGAHHIVQLSTDSFNCPGYDFKNSEDSAWMNT
jgi:hypothetical protein